MDFSGLAGGVISAGLGAETGGLLGGFGGAGGLGSLFDGGGAGNQPGDATSTAFASPFVNNANFQVGSSGNQGGASASASPSSSASASPGGSPYSYPNYGEGQLVQSPLNSTLILAGVGILLAALALFKA